jgi:hypothetical protein
MSMEWEEVKDPKGQYIIDISNSIAQSSYFPEDIQKLIDEKGVKEMVSEVNAHFKATTRRTALKFGRIDGKDAVLASVV